MIPCRKYFSETPVPQIYKYIKENIESIADKCSSLPQSVYQLLFLLLTFECSSRVLEKVYIYFDFIRNLNPTTFEVLHFKV